MLSVAHPKRQNFTRFPQKFCNIFFSVFSPQCFQNLLLFCISDYFISLTVILTCLFSCFNMDVSVRQREEYVSLSDDLRVPELFTDPTACFLLLACCLPHFIYSARILEEFHLIRLSLSPTYPSLYTSRDRGQQFLHTVKPLRLISQISCPSASTYIALQTNSSLLLRILVAAKIYDVLQYNYSPSIISLS